MSRLLTYPRSERLFGWKSTTAIRRYITSGDLMRVQIGNGMKLFPDTEESATAFLQNVPSSA
jgi:hypothetical protein